MGWECRAEMRAADRMISQNFEVCESIGGCRCQADLSEIFE
jgi:hypothetical protein